MGVFDDNLNALVESGRITEAEAAQLAEASPLKAERDEARRKADESAARAKTLETKVGAEVFAKVGVPGLPSTYNLPPEVDVTDAESVTKWAVEQQLIQPPPTIPSEEQAALARIAATSAGVGAGAPPPPPSAAQDMADLRKQIERAGAQQLPGLYQKALEAIEANGHVFGSLPSDGVITPGTL